MFNIMKVVLVAAGAVMITQGAAAQQFSTQDLARRVQQGGQALQMFNQADSDGSGTISEAEAIAIARDQFARADSNRDGQLTMNEIAAAKQTMSQQRMR